MSKAVVLFKKFKNSSLNKSRDLKKQEIAIFFISNIIHPLKFNNILCILKL